MPRAQDWLKVCLNREVWCSEEPQDAISGQVVRLFGCGQTAEIEGETCHITEEDWPNEVQGYNSPSSDILAKD